MLWIARRRNINRYRVAYENVLGTSLEIDLGVQSKSSGKEAERRILAEIDRLEDVFSIYKPESEFNRWQATQGKPTSVSADLATVLASAEHWRIESKGAFLPVVEALTRAWRQKERGNADALIPIVDPKETMWSVDVEAGMATRLTLRPASLNSIAKGYIVDRAVEVARAVDGVSQIMVNIGGDLCHWGDGEVYVGVPDPANPAENALPLSMVKVSNEAVATSGGYRRGFQVSGDWYSHVFDPTDSQPAQMVKSSSAIAQTAMLADIFATILGVLPPEVGLAFADETDSVGAFVVDSAGNCSQNACWKSKTSHR